MKSICVNVLTGIEQLEGYAEQWDYFRLHYSAENICSSHIWLLTWCQVFLQPDDELAIHCYFHNEQLIGIFPVYKKKITSGYQLRFIGTGEKEVEEVCSEFQDFIISPAYKSELLTLFSQAIEGMSDVVSLSFDNVLTNSIVAGWISNKDMQAWCQMKALPGNRYIIPVAEDDGKQLKSLTSKSSQRQAKKYIQHSDYRVVYATNDEQVQQFFSELSTLHNASWKSRGKMGVFENKNFCTFHHKLILKLNTLKQLVLFKIIDNQRTVAVFYGIKCGSILQYYQSGLVKIKSIPSTGMAMHVEALRYARMQGLQTYDLMKGAADSYKNRLTEPGSQVSSITAFKKYYFWLPYYWRIQNKLSILFR